MKKIVLVFMFVLFGKCAIGQIPACIWARQGTGDSEGYFINSDDNENIYFGGIYNDSITFGTTTLINTNSISEELFLTKYNSAGAVMWAKSSEGTGYTEFRNMTTDANGNVYVTGNYFNGNISFDSFILNSTVHSCLFLVKYDSSGTVLWAKNSDTASSVEGTGVATDSIGNVFLVGMFNSPTYIIGTDTLINKSIENVFTSKYDSQGNLIWAKCPADSGLVESYSIATDPQADFYITGRFNYSPVIFGNDTLINAAGYNFFIAKYDSSGNSIWAKAAGSANDIGNSVATNSTNYVYVTGTFTDSIITFGSHSLLNTNYNINGSGSTAFIVKYDSSGNSIRATTIYSATNCSLSDLVVDNNGNPYVSGGMGYPNSSPVNFDTLILDVPAGSTDPMFIVKYDSSGYALWALAFVSGGDDNNGIAVSASDNIYIGGDFIPNTFILGNDTLNNTAYESSFIAKFGSGNLEAISENRKAQNNITLYPNPTSGTITLSYNSQLSILNSQLKIYDVLGQQVYTQLITLPTSSESSLITLPQLSNGVYFYSLTPALSNGEGEIYRGKFVKQ